MLALPKWIRTIECRPLAGQTSVGSFGLRHDQVRARSAQAECNPVRQTHGSRLPQSCQAPSSQPPSWNEERYSAR